MGKRRRARIYALQFLFQQDITGNSFKDYMNALKLFWEIHNTEDEIHRFATTLVKGTLKHIVYIDDLIKEYSLHWDIERMGVVDRNILRFSIYELLYIENVPVKVTINEAIEIAKIYGTEDSGRFINGILDRISRDKINAKKYE